jgi:hypothetical protein
MVGTQKAKSMAEMTVKMVVRRLIMCELLRGSNLRRVLPFTRRMTGGVFYPLTAAFSPAQSKRWRGDTAEHGKHHASALRR